MLTGEENMPKGQFSLELFLTKRRERLDKFKNQHIKARTNQINAIRQKRGLPLLPIPVVLN